MAMRAIAFKRTDGLNDQRIEDRALHQIDELVPPLLRGSRSITVLPLRSTPKKARLRESGFHAARGAISAPMPRWWNASATTSRFQAA